ncbi:MAG: hypothetical protein IKC01_05575 [Clostridia bacterium]|nr:hypothetical protein [Clostridia bacterium]
MKIKRLFIVIIISAIIITMFLFFWHPLLKDEVSALTVADTVRLNIKQLTQKRCLEKGIFKEENFCTMLCVLPVEDYDTVTYDEILKYFPESCTENYFAVLVMFEDEGKFVSVKHITGFYKPFKEQVSASARADMRERILNYFNNAQLSQGYEYFIDIMFKCAQTGVFDANASAQKNSDAYQYSEKASEDYESYEEMYDNGYYYDGHYYENDDSDNLDYYIYAPDSDEDEDSFWIFERSDADNAYDRGYEEGLLAGEHDSPMENWHGGSAEVDDYEYYEGYIDGINDSDGYGDSYDPPIVDDGSYDLDDFYSDNDSGYEFENPDVYGDVDLGELPDVYGDFDYGYDDYGYDDYGYDDYGYDDYGYDDYDYDDYGY